jgi:4-aminobutyrate aminotransferase
MMSKANSLITRNLLPSALPRPARASLRLFSTTQPVMADMDTAAFGEQHIAKGIGRLTKHVFDEGKGTWITTDKGVKLLDLTAGIGVVNLGHCHPKVSAAAAKQCSKIT